MREPTRSFSPHEEASEASVGRTVPNGSGKRNPAGSGVDTPSRLRPGLTPLSERLGSGNGSRAARFGKQTALRALFAGSWR